MVMKLKNPHFEETEIAENRDLALCKEEDGKDDSKKQTDPSQPEDGKQKVASQIS